jgi:excinuclease ABC subunit C
LTTDLEERLANLPDHPGVYIMKDAHGKIIYIGKAISLKNRVRQYFQASRTHSVKVRAMVNNVESFEYILTDSELEALILECNLIKKHRPKYNILLKDDKHYPYVKVTMDEDFPRIVVTRSMKNDKARYFGPFTGMNAIKEMLEVVKKIFPVRTCKKNLDKKLGKERPCLNYYIKRCMGPCQGNISSEEYKKMMKQVCDFLGGKHEEVIRDLQMKMQEASQALNFEKAALYRDQIEAVQRVVQKQKAISTTMEDQDVIAFAREKDDIMAQMFFIRSGKLIGSQHFFLEESSETELREIIASFIKQYYLTASFIPREILLQEDIDEALIIERWLSDKKGSRVYIKVPRRGEKKKLVEMARRNATEALQNFKGKFLREKERTQGALEELARHLGLNETPNRIEAFDISNIQGTESVASMVVFEEGKPKYRDYRRFKIKTVTGANDYASMAEVVGRRYRRGLKELAERRENGLDPEEGRFSKLPDLILIDGGKGQLHAALGVLESLGLKSIPAIGLAEKFEEIYMEGQDAPILLPKHSNALHLIQRIRDEAHRFAVTYHRSLRGKKGTMSVLDEIPGIGKIRRKNLLKHFTTMDELKRASVEELAQVEGMNRQAAIAVYEYFHK